MSRKFTSNKSGFTLIELLMVILLVAILGVAALSSFVDTSGSFKFIQKYKELASTVRIVRSAAATVVEAERLGLKISNSTDGNIVVQAFADTGETPFELDDEDDLAPSPPLIIEDPFDIEVEGLSSPFPLYIFYDIGGKDVTVISNGTVQESGLVTLRFFDTKNGYERYLSIFQVSGLIEEFDESPL